MLKFSRMGNLIRAAAVLACTPMASGLWAGVVFSETFDSVAPAVFTEGDAGNLAGTDEAGPWVYTVGAVAGVNAFEIKADAPYGNHPSRVADDSANGDNAINLLCPLAAPLSMDTVDSLTISHKYFHVGEDTNGGRGLIVEVRDSADVGNKRYSFQFNTNNTNNMMTLQIGAFSGGFLPGVAGAFGDVFQATIKFTKDQPAPGSTRVNVDVVNLTNVGTFSHSSVEDRVAVLPAGTVFNEVQVFLARRAQGWIDDVVISTESGGSSVEDWRESFLTRNPADPARRILSSLNLGKRYMPAEFAAAR